MKVAIMQPYFFPYIGYFQLMDAVDLFVFYDDAQFMKGGWVNRNRILRDGAPAWWTYPIVREDYRLTIRERRYDRSDAQLQSLAGKLEGAYRRAPHYADTMPVIQAHLAHDDDRVSSFNQAHLAGLASMLGITCKVAVSSDIEHDDSLTGQARVLELCKRTGATHYINAIGGQSLYDPAAFEAEGIALSFVQPGAVAYPQFDAAPVPYLSIVDVLMFNSIAQTQALLRQCRLLHAGAAA
jgi:hypothetical protein